VPGLGRSHGWLGFAFFALVDFVRLSIRVHVAAALCAAALAPAIAGRPLETEDAGVLERGSCEVEGYAARLSAPGSRERTHSLQSGCGVGLSTQLALAVTLSRADDDAHGAHFGGKTHLWRGEAKDGEAPALTLAYALHGVKLGGQDWRHAASEARLVYSRLLTPALWLHANLGHARDEVSRARSTTWGLALEHATSGAWAPMAELFGDDRDAAWFNLGLRARLARDSWFIDASYGQQMSAAHPRLWTLGFKAVF
jgi:hypothetical protein